MVDFFGKGLYSSVKLRGAGGGQRATQVHADPAQCFMAPMQIQLSAPRRPCSSSSVLHVVFAPAGRKRRNFGSQKHPAATIFLKETIPSFFSPPVYATASSRGLISRGSSALWLYGSPAREARASFSHLRSISYAWTRIRRVASQPVGGTPKYHVLRGFVVD